MELIGSAAALVVPALGYPGFLGDQIVTNLVMRGNCIAASIPLALAEAVAAGCIQRGDRVVLFDLAAGLNLGGATLTY